MKNPSDLIERLRKQDAYMSEARERMAAVIRREFPNGEYADDEALVTHSIYREAADRIDQLECELAEARRQAFVEAAEIVCQSDEEEPSPISGNYEEVDMWRGKKEASRWLRAKAEESV